jgi:Fic family protein/DNA-binding XRE family transcriptional regulator
METKEKLKIIKKITGWTQEKMAQEIGVSFVSLNRWLKGKANPYLKNKKFIDNWYLEITGEKEISEEIIIKKKDKIFRKSKNYKNILREILSNNDILNQFLLKITYHSESIEGSTLTENDTFNVIFNDVCLSNKSLREQIEARNHKTAIEYSFNQLLENDNFKISENFILKLHSILMNGIRNDAGIYRQHSVRIVGSNVPTANYLKIEELMKNLIKEINKSEKNIISHIVKIHSDFEKIHPFSDGNGRIGRILMNVMLLRKNISPGIIKQEKKHLYYLYLNISQLKNIYNQLEDFVCDSILEGFDILERKNI